MALALSQFSTVNTGWHVKTLSRERYVQGKIFFQKGRKSANFCRLYPPSVIYLAR